MPPSEELVGEVARVVFTNDATGFGVVEVATGEDGGDDAPRAAGPLAGLLPGQPVRLVGRWQDHPRYGPTFETASCELIAPRSHDGLAAFLASSRFPGVGERLAARLVAAFGLEVGAVAETTPERLAEVRGVSPALAARIGAAWREAGAVAALVADLVGAGVPANIAQAVPRSLGENAAEVLAADPYALLRVRGAGWGHAEALARAQGLAGDDPRRLAAGAVAAHGELSRREGHVAVPEGQLAAAARRLLAPTEVGELEALERAAADGRLVCEAAGWYTPADRAAEETLADEVLRLAEARSRVVAATRDHEPDPHLTGEQAGAVSAALSRPVTVLTGGPGTGKTRTVLTVVQACEAAELRVALAAPTGRAAKRLEEVTGRGATTIHRLLEAHPAPGGGFAFGYDRHRRLPHDLVVVDEVSMADLRLAAALVQAVGSGAHLLLVGDVDQLPSVGPGAVLRDLLAAEPSGLVATARLSTVHRQAAASRIVTLAHEVNAGEVPPLRGAMGDVFAVPETSEQVADRVAEIVAVRAPAYFGCTAADVQVLAPMYRGPAGVNRLNARLKERLNPPRGRPAVAGLHEGDKVVQTRNDAELDVANGDIGEVVATDRAARTVEVAFPQGSVVYEGDRADDLAPAWCLTVHKAQGGEWPVVVLVCDPAHRPMLWRELVYTALSRARGGLLLVGDPSLVAVAARRVGAGARRRSTGLVQRLLHKSTERADTGGTGESEVR